MISTEQPQKSHSEVALKSEQLPITKKIYFSSENLKMS